MFQALFSWMPGGLALVTVVICTMFTWAGSGLTILSLGGLLVPVMIKTRYPENFHLEHGFESLKASTGIKLPPNTLRPVPVP